MSKQKNQRSITRMLFKIIFKSRFQKATGEMKQLPLLSQNPTIDDPASWREYWQKLGQTWRIEPEIDKKRQKFLSRCCTTIPNVKEGIYPFKNIRLSRADIEWLLATHEDDLRLMNWSDKNGWGRRGLDLRGADLRQLNLSSLPLACVRGGLNQNERMFATAEQCEMAGVHMERSNLREAHLKGADLYEAHLEGSSLYRAYLKKAYLRKAHMEGTNLCRASLEEAILIEAHLESAYLKETHLEGTNLREAHLEGAFLGQAFFDTATSLQNIILGNAKTGLVLLADVRWGGVNLSVVNWAQVKMLGDEYLAHQKKTSNGEKKEKTRRLDEYQAAVRANRQLAAALRDQGMHEDADRFAYHAQILYRKVLWWQQKFLTYFFAWFLYLLAGYGYRPGRSIIAYLLVIGTFAVIYFIFGMTISGVHHLEWYEALVVSLTAFHGRGFFADQFKPGDPQAFVAAVEAVVGLLIEISFIATFTQRFFGK